MIQQFAILIIWLNNDDIELENETFVSSNSEIQFDVYNPGWEEMIDVFYKHLILFLLPHNARN